MKGWMRIALALCAIALAAAILLPIWRIELSAPQYPEGLVLQIFASKLGGDVAIVNGLNHYIGMRILKEADFPEFKILPFILGFFALMSLVVAVIGKRRPLFVLFGMYVAFAILAMVDFWRWEHNYGHNLDPTAPIQVPGMSYQPPLIGYKQLLNFGAYSIPDTGGWLMAGAGLVMALCIFFIWREGRRSPTHIAALAFLFMGLSSCSTGPVPLKAGADACHFCKMTITDVRFGAEALNKKGKAWKFDDLHCISAFLKTGELKREDLKEVYFTRYDGDHGLLPGDKALLLQSEKLRSPMGSNVAAFADQKGLDEAIRQFGGTAVRWEDLKL